MSSPEPPTAPPPRVFSEHAPALLTTEHWSILATRSMTWAEASTRTTTYLTTLSAAVVALALVADATQFGDSFNVFAMVLLPVVLFLGVTTFVRLGQINEQDAHFVIAMNRLRHAYLELAPELAPYFVTAWHDDVAGIHRTFTFSSTRPFRPATQFLVTTPTVIASINSAVAAGGAALLCDLLDGSDAVLLVAAVATFIVAWLLHFRVQIRGIQRFRAEHVPQFPEP